ncbi:cytochrome b/b6 domain-containing protein [Tunturibacter empetritectus]|uniref:Thiosulfate reductase cytochrome b subunit n=1 Tax=Tunturiibacter lichenicola TaxID=2051959 RepID=A0A7W8JBA5_9BACT|nr:cytochrome b/b6 domain-containing protein [Edaphobacter lichenicola]MBB5344729.1 thiosulfate reductase cytochrome b subunit [Edaphobacter lichenicola]
MPEKPTDRREPIEELQPAAGTTQERVEAAPEISVAPRVEARDQAAEEPAAVAVSAPSTDQTLPVAANAVVTPVEAREPAVATVRLEKKHPLAIRWMHWVNFPVLFTMIWSGLLIYWNDSDNAYQHPHAVYRVGVGSLTVVRLFPPWFWKLINAPYRVTEGLGYHFFFMWIFAINGILYVSYLLISGEWRVLVPERRSFLDAIQVTLVDLHLRKGLPPQKKYNGAQKIAYTSVVLMGLGSLVTGLSIYKPTQVHWITSLLGGYEMARWEHFWLTMGFCAFFVVHVVQVILAGWNNFRSMVSGYEIVPAAKAPLEEERRVG